MNITPKLGIVYGAVAIIGIISATTITIALSQKTPTAPAHLPNASSSLSVTNTPRSVSLPSPKATSTIPLSIPQKQPSQSQQLKQAYVQEKTVSKPIANTASKTISTNITKKLQTNTVVRATTTQQKPPNLSHAVGTIRSVLVNITCKIKTARTILYTYGSGVVISPKGYILTNAHVAQYFLLKNYPSTKASACVIRTGSPARARYNATIVFLSSDWLYTSSTSTIQMTKPKSETGKHDIAVLAITGNANNDAHEKMPNLFPFVSLATNTPYVNEPVVIGSYAAQFISQNLLQSMLYPTITYGSIKKLYTFSSTTIDEVTLGGTAAAQEGSSGGGVLNANNKLTALVVTGTNTGPTNKRNLAALTASYVKRAYRQETGKSFASLLAQSTTTAVQNFSSVRQKMQRDYIRAFSQKK